MFNDILRSKWFAAAAVVLAGFFLASLLKIKPALVTTRKELNNLDTKVAEIKQSISEFERLGNYLKGNAYLERQTRLKLNYKKPDEKVVYIYSKETSMAGAQSVNKRVLKIFESKLAANLKSWWEYLTE